MIERSGGRRLEASDGRLRIPAQLSRALGADAAGRLELIDLDLIVEQLRDRVGGLAERGECLCVLDQFE
jgi:hypothetical protein